MAPLARHPRSRLDPARLLAGFSVAVATAIALGFLGNLAEPLDSFSHFRAHLGLAALLLAVIWLFARRWARSFALGLAGAAALVYSLFWHLPPLPGPSDSPTYRLLQMNLRWNSEGTLDAIRAIADTAPDIVTLQEMTPGWRAALAPLEAAYPFQVHCPGADGFRGDSALLSRRPFADESEPVCDERNSVAAARLDLNGVPLTIVSHHQLWPWPRGQWRRLERVTPLLQRIESPVLLAGDFNAVPWSAFVGRYASILGAKIVPGIGPVWAPVGVPDLARRTLGLPLANVLASPEIRVLSVERMASTRSDHLPVLVRFTVFLPEGPAPTTSVALR